MNTFFYKLFLGKPEFNIKLEHTAYRNQWKNLKNVWNNEKHHDIGFEKILRLFLILVQFIFPGLLIRDVFGKMGLAYKNLAIEVYVLMKVLIPLILLFTGLYKHVFFVVISSLFLFETICYVATLIFVSDAFAKPRSYRRSVLLLFLNYLEMVFVFAVIYGGLDLLCDKATKVNDFLYFSFVTSATIGFGDVFPTTDMGKTLVGVQSILFLVFIALFLNFFSSRVDAKDYFDDEGKC
jgi:hypothetical protein